MWFGMLWGKFWGLEELWESSGNLYIIKIPINHPRRRYVHMVRIESCCPKDTPEEETPKGVIAGTKCGTNADSKHRTDKTVLHGDKESEYKGSMEARLEAKFCSMIAASAKANTTQKDGGQVAKANETANTGGGAGVG